MRVTIVKGDGYVSVDGDGVHGIDMSSLDADIHAVQFFGTWGEIERVDLQTGRVVRNEYITDINPFSTILSLHAAAKAAEIAAAEEAARVAALGATYVDGATTGIPPEIKI